MSCIKKDQIWQNLIGEPLEYIVDEVYDNGWVNGTRVKVDDKGNKTPLKGTSISIHHDTMKFLMKQVS